MFWQILKPQWKQKYMRNILIVNYFEDQIADEWIDGGKSKATPTWTVIFRSVVNSMVLNNCSIEYIITTSTKNMGVPLYGSDI